MGEVNGDYNGKLNGVEEDDERVYEWESGLPNADDITPLSQGLIPLGLLTAFNIRPEPYRTSGEVSQASKDTVSLIRGSNYKSYDDEEDGEEDEQNDDESENNKKQRRNESPEDADSAAAEAAEDGGGGGGSGGDKAVKRARLVWTPQLHKRFVDVVGHLGIKNAVPKTIMQLMNVEGLTRENVASHLQKYRLYLKRMQGGSSSNSSSENGNGNGNGNGGMSVTVPVMPVPVPMMGMMGNYSRNGFESHSYSHNQPHTSNHYNHNQHQQYSNGNGNGNGMMMQSGNRYGSVMSYHHPTHVSPGDN
ncbi:hypothetical protein BVRB_7g173470 [Beta vulgaris subsp. vulgaris]|nr:hypothetical protein BVRB_7g173470 [Beta vulgaris subsp. vulgaris]